MRLVDERERDRKREKGFRRLAAIQNSYIQSLTEEGDEREEREIMKKA